ncbi:MAG: hypothetical protein RR406_05010, partial [Bacilli bacterium]
KKSLAGFDEMNILSDNSTEKSSIGGSTSSSLLENTGGEFNIGNNSLENFNSMKKIINDLLPLVKGLIASMVTLFALKGIKFALEQLEKFRYQWKLLTMALRDKKGSTSLKGNTDILMSGLTLITGGVVTLYETIKKVNNNWSEMSKMQKIITLSIGVLSIAVISLGVAFTAMWAGATMGASKVIAGVTAFIISIGALIAIFVSEKDAIKSTKDALNDLKTAQEEYKNANNDYISAVDSSKTAFENLKNAEKDAGISGQDLFNKVQAGTLDYANMTVKQQEVYKAYLANDEAQIKLKTSTEKLSEAKKKETLASFDNQLAIAAETGNYNDYKKSVIDAYKKGEISADEARDLIEKSMSRMSDASQKTFMEDLPNDIKNGMNPDEYQTAGQKMKNWFQTTFNKIGDWLYTKFTEIKDWFVQTFTKTIPNGIITGIETMINFLINAFEGMINAPLRGINKIIRKVNDIPGIEISLLPSVDFKNIRIPRLAKGGIAMQPTQAIIGEAGREAVLPLENNTEWMDNLADKISSRNSGNLTVPIYLPNGKLLAQYVIDTIKKQEFAYNGGVL